MTFDEAEANLERAILDYAQAAEERASLLTGWVMIGEFMDNDGTPELLAYAARSLPYWRINGMIEAAPDTIAYDYEDEGLE